MSYKTKPEVYLQILITMLIFLTLLVAAYKFFERSNLGKLISLATVCISLFTAWGNFYRQQRVLQGMEDLKLASSVQSWSLKIVLSANLCALGGLGLLMT